VFSWRGKHLFCKKQSTEVSPRAAVSHPDNGTGGKEGKRVGDAWALLKCFGVSKKKFCLAFTSNPNQLSPGGGGNRKTLYFTCPSSNKQRRWRGGTQE